MEGVGSYDDWLTDCMRLGDSIVASGSIEGAEGGEPAAGWCAAVPTPSRAEIASIVYSRWSL